MDPVTRRFRDGHTQTWWAADAALPAAGWGPDRRLRLVVATTDPATLPKLTTWYLVTNLPHPTGTGGTRGLRARRPGRAGGAVQPAQPGRAGRQAGQG